MNCRESADVPTYGDIIITEFILPPAESESGDQKWVEIYNTTDKRLRLNNLMLYDCPSNSCFRLSGFNLGESRQLCQFKTNDTTLLNMTDFTIGAGERIVVAESAALLPANLPTIVLDDCLIRFIQVDSQSLYNFDTLIWHGEW